MSVKNGWAVSGSLKKRLEGATGAIQLDSMPLWECQHRLILIVTKTDHRLQLESNQYSQLLKPKHTRSAWAIRSLLVASMSLAVVAGHRFI